MGSANLYPLLVSVCMVLHSCTNPNASLHLYFLPSYVCARIDSTRNVKKITKKICALNILRLTKPKKNVVFSRRVLLLWCTKVLLTFLEY